MLQVLTEEMGAGGMEQIPVWQITDPRLDFWEKGQVHINVPNSFRVNITAEKNAFYRITFS
jgi:hypothetical protein